MMLSTNAPPDAHRLSEIAPEVLRDNVFPLGAGVSVETGGLAA
jgi:hypothetical protein